MSKPIRTSQSIYRSGEKALQKAMAVILDESKTMTMAEMQKLVLLKEVQKLYAQQADMRTMIDGCAVLSEELVKWKDECKKLAKLITSVCDGNTLEDDITGRCQASTRDIDSAWLDVSRELKEMGTPVVDDLEDVY